MRKAYVRDRRALGDTQLPETGQRHRDVFDNTLRPPTEQTSQLLLTLCEVCVLYSFRSRTADLREPGIQPTMHSGECSVFVDMRDFHLIADVMTVTDIELHQVPTASSSVQYSIADSFAASEC